MTNHQNAAALVPPEVRQQTFKRIACENRAVAIIDIAKRFRRRRPGEQHLRARHLIVVRNLRLPVRRLGEGHVVARNENNDYIVLCPDLGPNSMLETR